MSKGQITWTTDNTTYAPWGVDLGYFPVPEPYVQEFINTVINRYRYVSSSVSSFVFWGNTLYAFPGWSCVQLVGPDSDAAKEKIEEIYKKIMNDIPAVERELFRTDRISIEGVWE